EKRDILSLQLQTPVLPPDTEVLQNSIGYISSESCIRRLNTLSAKVELRIKDISSSLEEVCCKRSKMSSIVSTGPWALRTFRSTHAVSNSLVVKSNSSLRVPERIMSMAGKIRRSASFRSRCNSRLPVPLNSS